MKISIIFHSVCGNTYLMAKAFYSRLKQLEKDVASASTSFGGGEACLQAINTFGQHMGMIPISVPSNLISGIDMSAYGIIHYSGPMADQRPNEDTLKAIDAYIKRFF